MEVRSWSRLLQLSCAGCHLRICFDYFPTYRFNCVHRQYFPTYHFDWVYSQNDMLQNRRNMCENDNLHRLIAVTSSEKPHLHDLIGFKELNMYQTPTLRDPYLELSAKYIDWAKAGVVNRMDISVVTSPKSTSTF